MTTSATREQLRDMIDRLPDRELGLAKRFLQFLILGEGDPMLIALEEAPIDEEELSEQALAALKQARADEAAGKGISWEEAKKEWNSE